MRANEEIAARPCDPASPPCVAWHPSRFAFWRQDEETGGQEMKLLAVMTMGRNVSGNAGLGTTLDWEFDMTSANFTGTDAGIPGDPRDFGRRR